MPTATPVLEKVVAHAELLSEEGHALPEVQLGEGGSTRPKVEVEAWGVRFGGGRTVVHYDAMYFRLPDDEAEQIPDGALVADLAASQSGVRGGDLAFRVRGRRPADRNSDGSPISDGGRWAGWTLLRVELAQCRRGSPEV